MSFTVEQGARFEGRQLGEVGVPPGCLIVGIERRNGRVLGVPQRDTRLMPGDKISVLVDPEAGQAADALQEGLSQSGD